MKKLLKVFYVCFAAATLTVTALAGAVGQRIGDEYKIIKGQGLTINTSLPVVTEYAAKDYDLNGINTIGEKIPVNIKLFGFIPVATTNVQIVDETYVAVLGTPFGIRIFTDGVMVVDIGEVETENGNLSPAKKAGIQKGDTIISIDGKKMNSNEDVLKTVEDSSGREMLFLIERDGKQKYMSFSAVKTNDGKYKAGIFVRDSSAGVGTLTFYSPTDNIVCGLGHGMADEDTGKLLTVDHGDLVSADIVSVTKGKSGEPGELRGRLTARKIANLSTNCDSGVYGNTVCNVDLSNLTEIAMKQDVYDGAATILSTVGNEGVKAYSCTVKLKNTSFSDKTQNFTVTVTDKDLLEKTGGIVQGMSGSPVIQNGRLIGAITHVLVDDPTTGYAIFAENMLETAQSVANSEKLRDAS